MSQQPMSEKEFHDDPPPATWYQVAHTGPHPVSYTIEVPQGQTYTDALERKLLRRARSTGSSPNVGKRLALAIVSILLSLVMLVITLSVAAAGSSDTFPVALLAIFMAFSFVGVLLILNVVFNRRK